MLAEERKLSATLVIKRVAAILLLLAFFLPLSQCTDSKTNPETKAIEKEVTVTYAYSGFEWSESIGDLAYEAAVCAAFLWPLVLSIASLIRSSLNQKLTIGILELLLCIGSWYMLNVITSFGELRYGAYLAYGSIGLYFITTLVQLVVRIREVKWLRLFKFFTEKDAT